ncbi:glycosyltransferase family 2 protein [Candidatus Omnitrophota bacterium]
MRVCIIIPAYNESAAIGGIIEQIRRQGLEVVVVDDGSCDNTALISENSGAIVLRNAINQGKGFSLIRGLIHAIDENYDAVITMDGDGQHSPEDICRFIQEAESSGAGIIIGNRMRSTTQMPLIRILTNKFMSLFISKLIKQNVSDTQCGFRLIKIDLLKKIRFTTQRFETESEILFQASKLGYRIKSIPIKTIYSKEKSQINPFLDTVRFCSFIWRQIWTTRS